MKILRIICVIIFLLLQFWIALSLAKISGAVNSKNKIRVNAEANISGDVSVIKHDFTPHWQ